MPVHLVSNTSPGAPVLSGTVGALLGVLDQALIIGRVFSYDGAAFTDRSAEARLDGGTAFTLFPDGDTNDIAYFGSPAQTLDAGGGYAPAFKQLVFALATLGIGGTYAWEYWNGSAWVALTVADGTSGLTQSGTVTWTPPSNWAPVAVNGVTTYWVRLRCTGAPSTNPTCASVSSTGWLRGFEGTNKAAYRQGAKTGRLRMFLRVDDSGPGAGGAREVRLRGFESMTDVDTGTGPWPTTLQMTNGFFARKSATLDATARPYVVIADGRTMHVFLATADVPGYFAFSWGDLYSYVPGDQYGLCCLGRTTENSSASNVERITDVLALGGTISTHYVPRPYTGVGTSLAVGKHTDSSKIGGAARFGTGGLPYTNPADGKLWTAPIWIHEPAQPTVRGHMRGLWAPCHDQINFTNLDWVNGSGPMAGRRLVLLKPVYNAGPVEACVLVEVSDTWDTD